MTVKKIGKALFMWLCIIILLVPIISSNVFAQVAALTKDSKEATIESLPSRNDGTSYKIGSHDVLKIVQHDDSSFSDVFYCVNAMKSLSVQQQEGYKYEKVADDFTNFDDEEVTEWANSLGVSKQYHKALCHLLNNIWLLKNKDTKKEFLGEVFDDYIKEQEAEDVQPPVTVDSIEQTLTDNDVDIIQQWAIWYFTNSDETAAGNPDNEYRKSEFDQLSAITISELNIGFSLEKKESQINGIRQIYMQKLYTYLIKSARESTDTLEPAEKTYPQIVDTSKNATSTIDGAYYKVGPFRISSGNFVPKDLKISLTDESNQALTNCKILVGSEEKENNALDSTIFDKDFYVKIPTEENTKTKTKIKLTLKYNKDAKRNISLWEKSEQETNDNDLQPVILILEEPGEEVSQEKEGTIEKGIYDLALRKYIVSINNNATQDRVPNPTTDSLQKLASDANTQTAEYRHTKEPLIVKKGDKIVYEFRIYNEGSLEAKVKKLVDYLPEGLKMVDAKSSPTNTKNNWTEENGALVTTCLENKPIKAFDKTNHTITCETVQLECEVTGDFDTGKILTNIAEIKEDNGEDRDSKVGSITDDNRNNDDFVGDSSNSKDDLGNKDKYYKGIEDDDDFEKVIIKKDYFDLSLQKFISKVNNNTENREPTVDVTKLKEGKEDADYKANKNPITVETGDIVTFTLRVYNEGDIDGYAEQITDYIPDGLGFLENYNTNKNNGWTVQDETSAEKVKLPTIRNALKNVETSDFIGETSLEDIDVILGKAKVTTNKLSSSSDSSNNNLIKAFDGSELKYKDIQIACIVVTEDTATLKNIAAITKEANGKKENVETDRGSKEKDSTPQDDIVPDDYTTGNQDDDDYDVLKTEKKRFDLALQKFITKVNEKNIEDRKPTLSKTGENIEYSHKDDPLIVKNGNDITYTIRVYNEGEIDGYASEITDDIPAGLEFDPNNATNKKYKWKMYDSSGAVTQDPKKAKKIKTTYLSKTENAENNLIKAFKKGEDVGDKNPDYKDVEVVFKFNKDLISDTKSIGERALVNTAEITGNTDETGKDVKDEDSTPGNNVETEDDIDKEKVTYRLFDLALQKFITEVNGSSISRREPQVTVDGNGSVTYKHTDTPLTVKDGDKITYTIRVYNEGEVDGYASEITDDIPEGLVFDPQDTINKQYGWEMYKDDNTKTEDKNEAKKIKTKYLDKKESSTENLITAFKTAEGNVGTPNYKDVKVVFQLNKKLITEDKPLGERELVNTAEISQDKDKDGEEVKDEDSTPNNNTSGEDDIDKERVTYELFDLALQKFITKVNGDSIDGREPKVTIGENGSVEYDHPNTPLVVKDGDKITYTIRVYNEGEVDGYASEISDNIPKGLIFDPQDDTNKKYEWKMYKEDGTEANSASEATKIKTKHLAKNGESEDNLIKAFKMAEGNGKTPNYKDVEVVFKLDRTALTTDERTLINIAEISGDTDKDGNEVKDEDSTPGNSENNEDDIDQEKVTYELFDLALQKFITKVNDNSIDNRTPTAKKGENGNVKYEHTKDPLIVKDGDKITYTIRVYNEGEMAGYAAEITDSIPEGLVFIPNDDTNEHYGWKMYNDDDREVKNANEATKIKTTYLAKKDGSTDNLIPAFNKEQGVSGTNPSYKDVKVVFQFNRQLITENKPIDQRVLENIAEISEDTDKDGKEVKDEDSTPGDGKDGDDDIDRERVTYRLFDLALQKFITEVNSDPIKNRDPKLTKNADGTIKYAHTQEPLKVKDGDEITYAIRVYNEGEVAGYASEITDSIPTGLEFLPENDVNQQYGWEMYDKDGHKTSNASEAVSVKTTYLAKKDDSKTNLIKAFDKNADISDTNPSYKDVKVVFKLNKELIAQNKPIDQRALINIAEITGNTDENGDNVKDEDSTPGNGEDVEDDIDRERVTYELFDLALQKFITKVNKDSIENRIPTAKGDGNGNIQYEHTEDPLKVNNEDEITYTIRVYNEGEMDGYASEISDDIPEGLVFDPENSTNRKYGWKMYKADGSETDDPSEAVSVKTTYLAKKEGSTDNLIPAFKKNVEISDTNPSHKDVELVFKVNVASLNTRVDLINTAEITKNTDKDGKNVKDEDSTPDNKVPNEDDIDKEQVYLEHIPEPEPLDFDLNLKKFISKVNDETLSREPKVDVAPLNLGSTDANYTTTKTPVEVKTGDVVTFTLRIYNEGEQLGFAEKITDYIPEGLGFLVNHNTNKNNLWKTDKNANTVKLSEVKNGMKNLSIADFSEVDGLEDVDVVLGKTKVSTNVLSSDKYTNIIEAFNGVDLKYKDTQITCIVVTEDETILKNIAAITDAKNETEEFVTDRDSTPIDDINPDDYTTGNEDDDDYDVLKTDKRKFDLALQKFITAVNSSEITDRIPVVTKDEEGNLHYKHPVEPVKVRNGDLITYTLRVYNEGEVDGYASEIADDIPTGLVFVPGNETNIEYKWKMYDANGEETKDENEAVRVKTTYLSKENSEDNLIPAFDKEADISDTNPSYKDVKLVFRLDESRISEKSSEKTLINTAEITENTDKDGEDIPDEDSTPDNNNPDEDDLDKERVKYLEFDMNLKKFISKVNKNKVDSREPEVDPSPLNEGEYDADYKTTKTPVEVDVGDIITFTLRVYNEGDIAGYAEQITDYIPEGLGFLVNYNTNKENLWEVVGDSQTVKLSTIRNGTKNVKLSDFSDVGNLENVDVVLGKAKVTTNVLSSANEENLLDGFDGTTMKYIDTQITCIVTTDDISILKNIAAITGETDDRKDPVDTDRGSEDKDSTPRDDINPDDYTTGNEDDDDYDVLKTKKKYYDLALRKFIVSVNGEATQDREPKFTEESLQKLADGTETTLEYRHSKKPISVKKGDKIVYEFRIYNEGEIDAVVGELTDYLPKGLTVLEGKEGVGNVKAEWKVNGNIVTTSYLENTTIPAFDKENLDISYVAIQLECEVTGDLTTGTVLTNVAEITGDDEDDRDSKEGSIKPEDITDDFSGDPTNKDDLGDKDYHYKGLQDDDDFEKVVIEGDLFDLNLKKFISKVNNENLDRAPKVDPSPLNNGRNDADYETIKTPVNVKTGDIVTFTLRIYNEGDIAGYADKITDYIPEGLGFLVNYKTNNENLWNPASNADSVKLSTIKNGTKNVKLSDFSDVDNLEDVEVILGETKVTTSVLAYSKGNTKNLIPAFDGNTMTYKDVQVSCIVVTEDEITLKNIAAITGEKDKNGDEVDEDRDSTPKDDINPDDYTTGNEDDDDYDVVKTDKKDFDLALQKFITAVNSNAINDRVPTVVKDANGELQYNHKTDPVRVHNGDLITYTLRVYNEGEVDGYAEEVTDNIPTGLVFVPDNETNIKYGWKMYDKAGNETKDVSQAVSVKTTYLSKANSKDNLIPAFNKDAEISSTNPSYKDVELVFRLDESMINKTVTTSERTLINIAEISKNTDKDGNDIPDVDSTPNNGNPNEDDIDKEQVYVEYFDLALEKDLTKALVTVEGKTTELNVAKGETIKVDVNRKKLSKTTIKFIYDIVVRNEGEIEGYATEVTDYIPQGLSFDPADNPEWEQVSGHKILTNALAKTLLQPGESARVSVMLTWERNESNMGEFINVAEISEHWNPYGSPDVDSTPNNLVPTEDDYDNAPVYVSIITGLGERPYILLTSVVLVILGTGIVLIKKYVL